MHIGIDLGGTKTEIIVLDENSNEHYRYREPTHKGDYQKTLSAIADLVSQAEKKVNTACSVGIGIPGTISPDSGNVKNANSTWLIGHPLATDLESILNRPIAVANDADCFTLSEATDGAGKGYNSVFGVILGTGVGGGFYVYSQLLNGPNAIAGEWGHNPLPWPKHNELPGEKCYCGKFGCIETWLSGPALEREYNRLSGQKLNAESLIAANNEFTKICLENYYSRLAKSLASVINILDPQIVVLGGGLSNINQLYPEVNARLIEYIFSDQVNTPIVANIHGDSSGVRGAAWLGTTLNQNLGRS